MRLDRLRIYYHSEVYNETSLRSKAYLNDLLVNEINQCLTVCGCLSFNCDRNEREFYIISLLPSPITHKRNCKECTVDMPTGTLYVNTKIPTCISEERPGPSKCSLIFKWQRKIDSLSAPDRLLLQKPQPITSMLIHVDFIPALEPLKLSPCGAFFTNMTT